MQGFDTGSEPAGSISVGCKPPSNHQCYASLSDLIKKMILRFEQLGWWVESRGECITLHQKTEGGKPEKSYHISIYYEQYISETYFQADESLEVGYQLTEIQSIRQKPWMVKVLSQSAISFESFDEAAKKFLSYSETLAPINGDSDQ